tara:strand:- start:1778 stop:2038 length:261 start_codon:yes stop_codon:yes gene_type:complete
MSKPLKENRFTLAKARSKAEDWQSDYSGKVNVTCGNCGEHVHGYLNGYIESNDYGKYFTGPVKPFTPTVEAPVEEKSQDPDEDIPF